MRTVFGREQEVSTVGTLFATHRLVTIVGAGGVGKTTVVRAFEMRTAEAYADGTTFIELAGLDDPRFLVGTLATALGVSIGGSVDSRGLMSRVLEALRDKRLLLILDSCENHLQQVSALAETILGATNHLRILTTSREPLFAQGEAVHWLQPMALPDLGQTLNAKHALTYPAVALFVDVATTSRCTFELQDEQVQGVINICRRLDGVPLAIELAAAAVHRIGVENLASQLDRVLWETGDTVSTSPARHRTLGAMLEWSYGMLTDGEKRAFHRLSVFRSWFALESAVAVVGDTPEAHTAAMDIVLALVDKSLVHIASTQGDGRFRLLDTTRAYAARKLEAVMDEADARRLHAQHVGSTMSAAESDWEVLTVVQWRAKYIAWLDDIRAALEWAFSDQGNAELGVKLTVDAFPLADQTALMADVDNQLDRAMKVLANLPDSLPWYEMRLKTAIGLTYQRQDVERSDMEAALTAAFEMARTTGSAKYQVGPLLALWSTAFQHASYAQALPWSSRIGEVSRQYGDSIAELTFARTQAQTLHFLGRHEEALPLALHVIDNGWRRIPLGYMPSPVDMRVSSRIIVARIKWMQGFALQAQAEAAKCVEAAARDSPTSLCQALGLAAIPIASWCGDDAACRLLIDRLNEHASRFGFDYWVAWSLRYADALDLRARNTGFVPRMQIRNQGANADKQTDHLCTFDVMLCNEHSLSRVRAGKVGWCASETIRAQGERLLANGVASEACIAAAEECFSEAIGIARHQGALAWELRAATSLARLMSQDGRHDAATQMLRLVKDRYTEGFETADFAAAKALLPER